MENDMSKYDPRQIQVLEGLQAVRKRPGMYIGTTDLRGLHHLVREVLDNSVDEALAGFCSHIEVTINEDGSCTVKDDGRGIPTGIMETEGKSAVEVVLTKLHAGGKFGGTGYKISGGLHGVGLAAVNALSSKLTVEVRQQGKLFRQEYRKGVPQGDLKEIEDCCEVGTKITFFPDETIFDSIKFDFDTIKTRVRELAFLNKGLEIILEDKREGLEKKEVFYYEGGIINYIEIQNKSKEVLLPEVFYIEEQRGDDIVECALQINTKFDEKILAFANNINTVEGGVHVDGFKFALTKVYNEFAQKNNYLKDGPKLTGEDVREGLTAIISVKLTEPQFEGQTKTKLGNRTMRTLVNNIVSEKLGEYFEENPAIARILIEKALKAQRAREAAQKIKEAIRKDAMEGGTLPGKLTDCSDKNPLNCEVFLVEGDSAGGTAKSGRDRRFQAILPLRGKIINVEKARQDKILSNEEIKAMIHAFGCGYKDAFDLEKRRYDRIICMTDADVDGSHIRILLLTFFYRYLKPLVDNGHIYIARPPLFKVSRGKEEKYFYSDAELQNYLDSIGEARYEIQRYKGLGEMNAEQLWETTMNPETRTLLRVAIEDAEAADEIFTRLMGEDPAVRREFIEENATLVADLDI